MAMKNLEPEEEVNIEGVGSFPDEPLLTEPKLLPSFFEANEIIMGFIQDSEYS
jgi:hypothetical protein